MGAEMNYKIKLNREGLKRAALAWLQESSAQMGENFDLCYWNKSEQEEPEMVEEWLVCAELVILAYRKYEELEAQNVA